MNQILYRVNGRTGGTKKKNCNICVSMMYDMYNVILISSTSSLATFHFRRQIDNWPNNISDLTSYPPSWKKVVGLLVTEKRQTGWWIRRRAKTNIFKGGNVLLGQKQSWFVLVLMASCNIFLSLFCRSFRWVIVCSASVPWRHVRDSRHTYSYQYY